jgi:predicted nucleotidyltransferase
MVVQSPNSITPLPGRVVSEQEEMSMAPLVTVDTKPVEEAIRRIMPAFPEVAGVYLFGSVLGPCRPDSDIDLGLVTGTCMPASASPLERERLEARVAMALGRWEGHGVDAVVLDAHDPIFSFKVISSGRLVYTGNKERVTDFIEVVAQGYRQAYPR